MQGKGSKIREKQIFNIQSSFLRSTHLERDWNDPSALDNYVFTPLAARNLARFTMGLNGSSSLRAWRITGDYGSGKSSYALLLANVLSKRWKAFQPNVKSAIVGAASNLTKAEIPRVVPILVTGSRESLGKAILRGLLQTLKDEKIPKTFYAKLEQALNQDLTDDIVLDWLKKSNEQINKSKIGDGLALILDEAGKFLEYAVMKPEQQDVYLLQRLAESAARSAKRPFFVVTIFHQGISSYAESLPKTQQREWEKVAGRFEELIWHHPVDQTVELIVHSLNTNADLISGANSSVAKKDMKQAVDDLWYGSTVNLKALVQNALGLFPIHPTVVPILVKLFSSYGQNERSLYSFLLGTESFGLQDHVIQKGIKEFYRLHDLYDYARNAFGSKLSALSYHWKAIDTSIRSFKHDDELSLRLLKTIGIINLINSDNLVASKDILSLCVGEDISKILQRLEKAHQLHYRGRAGGYCVWPNTSVNLSEAYESARKEISSSKHFAHLLHPRLETRPIVARRHYIETGNLRYFEVRYLDIENMDEQAAAPTTADGLILIPLCEKESDRRKALAFAKSLSSNAHQTTLFVVSPALNHLASRLDEVLCWEWVERSVGELRHDQFARAEVSRQLALYRQELQTEIQKAIGLTTIEKDSDLSWYHMGALVKNLNSGKRVMALLSDLCDNAYSSAPIIHNELVNRRELSSAAASARLRLCERLFEFSNEPFLGMDATKHPPEMSMYLSVLQQAGLHTKNKESNIWSVGLPEKRYDSAHGRVLPAMHRVHEILKGQTDNRVSVLEVINSLKQKPYGVMDGMIPLLIAVFAVIHEDELAFYEDGTFITRLSGSVFLRLIKAPETFDIQYYPISGVRTALFHQLVNELQLSKTDKKNVDILDVVKPLMIFMSGLPEYVANTTTLTPQTIAVRSVLRTTTDPVQLLFHELPKACGIASIAVEKNKNDKNVETFVSALKSSIDELRSAYSSLLKSMQDRMLKEFQLKGKLQSQRPLLAARANRIAGFVTEINLKSFCLRLADQSLGDNLWLESIGSLLCSMPPSKWRDRDDHKFDQEIHKFVSQFLRVEATLFKQLKNEHEGLSIRLALTRSNGAEKDQVIHLTTEQAKEMEIVAAQIKKVLSGHGQVGIAAASEVLWKMLAGETK